MDLTAFAPEKCVHGHDLAVGAGHRRVLTFSCECAGLARHHIRVVCFTCVLNGCTDCVWYDPPHQGLP